MIKINTLKSESQREKWLTFVDALIVDTVTKSSGEAQDLFLLSSGDGPNMFGAEHHTLGPEAGSVKMTSRQNAVFVDLIEAIGDALKEIEISDTSSLGDLVNLYYHQGI